MTDDQLRALIRDAVARHLGGAAQSSLPPLPGRAIEASAWPRVSPADTHAMQAGPDLTRVDLIPESIATRALAPGAVTIANAPGGVAIAAAPGSVVHVHISHATFSLPTALDGSFDGPCRTEPHAGCTNCGFCQSLGY